MFASRIIAAAAAAAAFSLPAAAAPVSLGVVTHLYGSNAGRVSPTSFQTLNPPTWNACDTVNAASVTVRNTSNCQRFADAFDFSGIDFDSIGSFRLTLNYASTNGFLEFWAARPAEDYGTGSGSMSYLTGVGGGGASTTFTFDDQLDVFDGIVDGGVFYLWFAQQGLGQQNFTLTSASLEVIGTPAVEAVPEPGSLALAGLGVLALVAARRRRR